MSYIYEISIQGEFKKICNFLVYYFWTPPLPPPPINFVHAHIQHMDKVGHVAAAPGPLACPSRGARPSIEPVLAAALRPEIFLT